MQTKGFIKVITVALIAICVYYLSFTFVSNSYQNDAEEYALSVANPETSPKEYNDALNQYLDSLNKQTVWLGNTFQEVREKELGLGLDLKGGMNVTLQISVPDILNALAGNSKDKNFEKAIKSVDYAAQEDFVEAFCTKYEELEPGVQLAQVFRGIEKVKADPTASNEKVKGILKEEVESMVDNSYNVLRNRIDRFGVVSPNIQKLQSTGRILLELPGIKDPVRVRKLLKGAANLEFYETYLGNEVSKYLKTLSERAAGVEAPVAETKAAEPKAEEAKDAKVAEAKDAKVAEAKDVKDAEAKDAKVAEAKDAKVAEAKDAKAAEAKEVKAAEPKVAEAKPAKPAKANAGKTLADMLLFNNNPTPEAGSADARDTSAINKIIYSEVAKSVLPGDLKLAWKVKPDVDKNGKEYFSLIALKTSANGEPVLSGDVITDAGTNLDQMQGMEVTMSMNDEGARRWSRITADNIGKCIAIVLDGQVYSYPSIRNQIDGGRSSITGNFTPQEATDLANVLKSGKMVAAVDIVSESIIGPSLGQESIEKGITSFIIALILLMIFMMCAYGVKAGNIANLGLIMNLFFTIGILASFQSVLTLPGIAGIVLALGMAVDANVLIFERCKEELRAGKGLKTAVADGYSNAFSAIFDSNLTSIITGAILIALGSGPIKGFAVTLVVGILCSFFTAVFATRLVMEWCINKGWFNGMTFTTGLTKKLMENVKFNFMGKAKTAWIGVGVCVAIFAALFAMRGLNAGIDFSGGRNFVVQFKHGVNTAELQKQLEPLFEGANVSVITIDNETKARVSTNYKIDSKEKNIDDEIMDKLYNGLKPELDKDNISKADFGVNNETVGVVSSDVVGPSIASDMTREAIWAVFFSLLAMALYILFRFRNVAFSLGALAAVAFTSFVVIGFYTLHGLLPFSMEVDQTFIAAILTVIGYQVNDTVVVFDRVREYRKLFPKQSQDETFNKALCSTLSRTLMTSVTTLLVLLVIFFFGGESIRSFIFAMILGVVIGTCASLFIASPVAYKFANRKKAAK